MYNKKSEPYLCGNNDDKTEPQLNNETVNEVSFYIFISINGNIIIIFYLVRVLYLQIFSMSRKLIFHPSDIQFHPPLRMHVITRGRHSFRLL